MSLPNPPSVNSPIPNQPFYTPEEPATFDRLSGVLTPNIQLEPNPTYDPDDWVRPSDWLPLPSVSPTDEKFTGLFAVYNVDANFLALKFEGDYTVDWGDGSIENYSSGEKAQHNYSWESAKAETPQGYKQVVVTVVPQTGHHLTYMNLAVPHDSQSLGSYDWLGKSWLDITFSLPFNEGYLQIGYNFEGNKSVYLPTLEKLTILNTGVTDDLTATLNGNCPVLKELVVKNAHQVSDIGGMCENLHSLQRASMEGLSSVLIMNGCFDRCGSLKSVSMKDLNSLEVIPQMLDSCYSIQRVRMYGLINCIDASYAFDNCNTLRQVVLSGTSNLEIADGMFSDCWSLQVAELDTSNVTSMDWMFNHCYTLQDIPTYDTSKVESMWGAFFDCWSLSSFPALDTSSLTYAVDMLGACTYLQSIPLIDTSSVEDASYMFEGCSNLRTLPALDFSSCLNFDWSVNYDCHCLTSAPFQNVSANISFSDCCLSRNAIVEIFNGLANASATIDVSYNYGAADLTAEDLAIAENKGWTVTY